jgi:N-hydroxyarylamine O-acetyltransferase
VRKAGSVDDELFQKAWLDRIGYSGSLTPTLEALNGLVLAHSRAISYETLVGSVLESVVFF